MATLPKRRFLSFLCLAATLLSSCAVSLGGFEEEGGGYAKYYSSFGDVTGLYDGGSLSYDIEDSLFNPYTVNSCTWEKKEYEVEKKEYVYLVLPFKTACVVDSIALYFYSDTEETIELSAFYFLSAELAPKKIKYLTSPDTEPIYDSEGQQIGEKEIEYDDPPAETAAIRGSLTIPANSWTSCVMASFRQMGYEDEYIHGGEGGCFYLRVENNSGHNKSTMKPVAFSFTNLLVHSLT